MNCKLIIRTTLQNKAKMAAIGVGEVEKSPPDSNCNSANNMKFSRNCPKFWPNTFFQISNCHISAFTNLILLKFAVLNMSKCAC